MRDREIGQYDFFPSDMFFNTEYWEPHYVYLLHQDSPHSLDFSLNIDGVRKRIAATNDPNMVNGGIPELDITEDFLLFLNGKL